MNLFEMQAIAGGISREEYCAELDAIMSDNWGKFTKSEKRAAAKSFAQNCYVKIYVTVSISFRGY